MQTTTNLVTSVSNSSTDTQYPSAKCVYDEIQTVKRNIGEIVQSTIPLTDAGLHLLDGSLLAYGSYQAFIDYVADLYNSGNYDDIFSPEANWQQAVSDYGVCGKFVYDSTNNTVRLPKITGILEGTTDVTALGDLVEAGLPNITGEFIGGNQNGTISGAFEFVGNSLSAQAGSSYREAQMSFDASNSSSIYGNSTTVQPQTVKAFYYIVIATSTKTEIQVDIDEIVTDLNGKADVDLSNVPNSKGILTESYVNGASWYRVYSDGWCEQGGMASGTLGTLVQVALIKSYKDTSYNILLTATHTNEPAAADNNRFASVNTTYLGVNSFKYLVTSTTNNSGNPVYWRTSGYIY